MKLIIVTYLGSLYLAECAIDLKKIWKSLFHVIFILTDVTFKKNIYQGTQKSEQFIHSL